MKRKALGKGLSALLPDPDPVEAPVVPESTREVPIGALEPNPVQPRTVMADTALSELEASIRESGIVQPILVPRNQPLQPLQRYCR